MFSIAYYKADDYYIVFKKTHALLFNQFSFYLIYELKSKVVHSYFLLFWTNCS